MNKKNDEENSRPQVSEGFGKASHCQAKSRHSLLLNQV